MLTPRKITPEPFHFLATPRALKIASEPDNGAGAWKETIVQGLVSQESGLHSRARDAEARIEYNA